MTQREESDNVRVTLTWDHRIVGTAELPTDWFERGGNLSIIIKPDLWGGETPAAARRSWADMLAGYVREHGQPWNEATRFEIKLEPR